MNEIKELNILFTCKVATYHEATVLKEQGEIHNAILSIIRERLNGRAVLTGDTLEVVRKVNNEI